MSNEGGITATKRPSGLDMGMFEEIEPPSYSKQTGVLHVPCTVAQVHIYDLYKNMLNILSSRDFGKSVKTYGPRSQGFWAHTTHTHTVYGQTATAETSIQTASVRGKQLLQRERERDWRISWAQEFILSTGSSAGRLRLSTGGWTPHLFIFFKTVAAACPCPSLCPLEEPHIHLSHYQDISLGVQILEHTNTLHSF